MSRGPRAGGVDGALGGRAVGSWEGRGGGAERRRGGWGRGGVEEAKRCGGWGRGGGRSDGGGMGGQPQWPPSSLVLVTFIECWVSILDGLFLLPVRFLVGDPILLVHSNEHVSDMI